ncbi:hypothetical protein IQ260_13470 [Leptolyngbya cf. ectocarpi LEGE 11479]|uniref:Uncharacterized protein n=1 Tax=Leptolyngbya cf. ectocarpi LEGE 11479 TaxID=1828722 RepID=A0A928ZUJ0_LEPEC|nr:hypothetical protein [Leptolyngbya ectocarpi]MBE9067665.1 hypothetical protein [Leptolyngbya cf. ectocarpi LEGE 11479]
MNGKQLKRREPTMHKSPMSPKYPHDRRYVMGKGIALCAVAFVLIFAASGHSGRLIGSAYPLLDSHPGQFAAYFFAGFAGICGLDLIRRS